MLLRSLHHPHRDSRAQPLPRGCDMVTVTFLRMTTAGLSSLLADGHAGWADAGEDVVCAAVSAILQAAWLGLMEHAELRSPPTVRGATQPALAG